MYHEALKSSHGFLCRPLITFRKRTNERTDEGGREDRTADICSPVIFGWNILFSFCYSRPGIALCVVITFSLFLFDELDDNTEQGRKSCDFSRLSSNRRILALETIGASQMELFGRGRGSLLQNYCAFNVALSHQVKSTRNDRKTDSSNCLLSIWFDIPERTVTHTSGVCES